MEKQEYQKIRAYREQNQLFCQMKLESEIRELMQKIEKFEVLEHTIPSVLLQELEPLQRQISLLILRLKSSCDATYTERR